jgi:hypothetical protein
MSIEEQIDFLISLIPYSIITFLMGQYIKLHDLWNAIKKQFYVSIDALQTSFEDTYLEFYRVNDMYIPVVTSANKRPYNSEPIWIYNLKRKTFTLEELGSHSSYPIPFIGASLSYKNGLEEENPIGDLSEWIMDQSINGPDGVLPLQVLVGAWRYAQEKILMISYSGFIFSGITCDGDEARYDLKTEKEIVD